MAQKKNKDRKQNLINFKNQVKRKMAENQEQSIPQIRQFPQWASDSKIEVTGMEWEAIYNCINIFRQGIVASESVMQRNVESGVITNKFVDAEGKDVSPEDVATYTKQLQELFQKRVADQQKAETKSEPTGILTADGEPAATTSSKDAQESKDTENPLHAV